MNYLDFVDNRGRGRPLKYPLGTFAVGDAMFFANATSDHIHSRAPDYRPKRFCARAMVVNGERGVMVWRLA